MAINKTFNHSLILRLVLVVLLSCVLTVCIIYKQVPLTIICFLILLKTGFNLVHYLNSTNRKLTLFFEAILNDDTTLVFNEKQSNKEIINLNRSLNRINKHIADLKLRNEENEHFLNELIKKSATGLLALDQNGYVVQINQAALKIFGLPFLANIQLLHQKNETLFRVINELAVGKTQTVKLIEKNAIRHVSIKASQLDFANRHCRIFSLNDIHTEIEENELNSWQKLISVLTHEIMNSLAPVTSLSNTLKRFLTRNGKAVSPKEITVNDIEQTLMGLSVIEERGKGLLDFVDNYRKLARIPRPIFNAIYIVDWLNQVKLLMKCKLEEKNINFEIQRLEQQTSFKGDEKLLSQALLNLLNNAVDAVEESSRPKIVLQTSVNEHGNICIRVSDNGSGITPENIDNIFIPFFTTKDYGSGIGLSLARRIIHLHGGSMSVHSIPNQETTFTLAF